MKKNIHTSGHILTLFVFLLCLTGVIQAQDPLPGIVPEPVSPPNGADNQPVDPIFEWEPVIGAETYHLQVAMDAGFSNLVVDAGGLTSTSRRVAGLNPETTYYWRVRASNFIATTDWSDVWSFTTESVPSNPPETPVLVSPANGTDNISTGPTLTWNASEGAETYRLQVATDPGFSSPVIDVAGHSSTSHPASGLNYSTTYYWRVQASNSDGESPWSAEWSFTTEEAPPAPPSAPALVSPANGADNISTSPTLTWNASEGAEAYRLQVATDPGFSSRNVNIETGSTSHQVSPLSRSTTYYWRVQASNSGGTSGWSEIRSFTTVEQPPFTPELFSPADGTRGIGTNTTLDWLAANRAETYHLQVATDANFNNMVVEAMELTVTSHDVSDLVPNSVHYWRVRASNEGGDSDWSEVWQFTTSGSMPGAPELSSPPNESTGISTNPVLQWQPAAGAESYGLQVSRTQTFTTHVINIDMGITDTQYQVTGLDPSTTYYWRVQSVPQDGTSAWSAVWGFTTGDETGQPPEAPVLASPANGSDGISTSPVFDWNASEDAESYQLQVAVDAGFGSLVIDETGLSSTSHQISGLNYATTYYWRVQASNSDGESPWSAEWSFTTENQPQSPPGAPGLASPFDGETGVSITPTVEWMTAERTGSYELQISTNEDFSNMVVNEQGITTTSRQVNLSQNTAYYWRVRGVNQQGAGPWSDIWSFTTESTDSPIIISSPARGVIWKAREAWSIEWEIQDQNIATLRLEYSTDGGRSWESIAESVDADAGKYTWYIPDTSSTKTRIRISDTNEPARLAVSAPFVVYPVTIRRSVTYTFNSGSASSDYRLIGLPGDVATGVGELFPGTPGDDWNAYYDNGSDNDYMVEYNGSEQFTFRPGRGFWVISKQEIQLTDSIQPVSLNEDTGYAIPLHPGWNIISNPFDIPVAWDKVRAINNLSEPIWSFNGSFNREDTLDLYRGYYLNNSMGLSELKIPYGTSASSPSSTETTKGKKPEPRIFILSVIEDQQLHSSIEIGFDHKEEGTRYLAPPGDFQQYRLTILKERDRHLALEYRPIVGDLQQFQLQLKAEPNKQIQLIGSGKDQLKAYEIWLFDRQTGKSFDLHDNTPVYLKPTQKNTRYTLVVGSGAAVDTLKQNMAPSQITLEQNHPNPFSDQTTIEYSIPEPFENQQVLLEIYDLLGRKIETLVDSPQPADFYTVQWNNPGGLASGVYFYRLQVGEFSKVAKMTLIK